jgi:hypothetical protein
LEKAVGYALTKAGYKVVVGFEYEYADGIKGDIDVAAYKNGELIVIEVKSGYFTEDYEYSKQIETLTLEGTASEQLEKSLNYLQSEWATAKRSLKIETPKPYEKIKVIPLIVTNYLEGDLNIYKNRFRKISLLELDIITTNRKKELFVINGIPYSFLNHLKDENNPNLNNAGVKKDSVDYDLWNGKKHFNGDILKECIDQNKVWGDIEDDWLFPQISAML